VSVEQNTVVLVVDDDARVRAALATLLRGAGYRVEVASDGEQGFKLLCRLPVDVVLTDLSMPNVDGIELIRLVRRDPFLLHLPVIAMAPFGSARQVEAKDVGATACADQPVRNEQIIAMVQLVLDAAHDRLRSSGIRGGPLTRTDSDSGSVLFRSRKEEDAPPNSKRTRSKSQRLSRGTAEAPADWLVSTAALVNEAISAGRSNEAEAMLETWLDAVLSDAHNGRLASNGTYDAAIRQALILAGATHRGRWVDYVIDLQHTRAICPSAELTTELIRLAREVDRIDIKQLKSYVTAVRLLPPSFDSVRATRYLEQLLMLRSRRRAV
jgi:CheY-like chemotaxis protein